MARTTVMGGKSWELEGPEIKVGQSAPDFQLVGTDMSIVSLASAKGKTRLLLPLPSLDTPVCDLETRRFNEEAAALGEGVEIWVISTDLPFAQKRFCVANGIQRVKALSDHLDVSFGKAYGTLIKEARLLSRAVFVVDPTDKISYVEYVPQVGQHPNYDAVLRALRQVATV